MSFAERQRNFFPISLLQVVANYFGNTKLYEPYPGRKIRWAGPYTEAPPDTPKCGFDNSKCPPESKIFLYICVFVDLCDFSSRCWDLYIPNHRYILNWEYEHENILSPFSKKHRRLFAFVNSFKCQTRTDRSVTPVWK